MGTCGLCHQLDSELQDSHFLAAGFLRRLRGDGNGNQNPFLMSLGWIGQTSKPAMQPLLCQACEERFNANGERWVIANAYNPQTGRFSLRECLTSAQPILAGLHGGAYDASKIHGIDIEQLVYFGASVIWRATVRSWRIQKEHYEQLPIDAVYQEDLRLYLLGKAEFPADAVSVVYVSPSLVPPLSAGYPERLQEDGYAIYRFYVPGLWFILACGSNLNQDNRKMCILRSSVHPLCLYVGGDALVHQINFNLYMEDKARR